MTRKDYQLIAAALYRARPTEASGALEVLQWVSDSLSIADALQADNPRFDRRRFLAACGHGSVEAYQAKLARAE